ncbi:septum formation initiator family protein [Pueribacillus sp. YX66]|uniref:FtsB family cell division protein n=1 Tax=Pueribacillus sp. YX66 TaxID=3229242 RepID=UPI00358D24ED
MSQARRRALQEATLKYVQEKQVYDKIRKRRRRGLYRRLTAYCLMSVVLSVCFISIFISQKKLLNDKVEEKESLQKELEFVEKQEINLREEINKLNDYEYVGELARRDYFFSNDGETIFSFPDESTTN